MILTIQTSSFGVYGGIPTYNRLVCRTLDGLGDSFDTHVLIGTDEPGNLQEHLRVLPNLTLEALAGSRSALVRRALSLAMRRRIDLLLVGHVNYSPLGLVLRTLQPGLRYGVFMYGIDVWKELPPLHRRALQGANFLISISDYTKRRAVEMNNIRAENVHLLPNALEWLPEDLAAKTSGTPRPAGPTLLSVCRLDSSERYKGVDTVIEALPSIAAHVPDVQYILVGSGTDLGRLKRLADDVGVSGRVHFKGSVDDSTLRTYYQTCDVFVLPSAGEGFGFVYLEAMQYAKPIVAADSGGSPEVVQDGVTGLLVQYGDVARLAQVLIRLCLDSSLSTCLGQAGYRRLQEFYTYPGFSRQLTDILLSEVPPAAIYRARGRALSS